MRVEIFGQEYNVKSDEGEERVRKITEYVNQKIKEISESAKTVSLVNVAILTALNIANDYFEVVENQNHYNHTIEVKSGQLIEMINSQIS